MTHLELVARAIAPEAWSGAEHEDGPGIVAIRRLASLQQARRAIGIMRMNGARSCGLCDGQPECACIESNHFMAESA